MILNEKRGDDGVGKHTTRAKRMRTVNMLVVGAPRPLPPPPTSLREVHGDAIQNEPCYGCIPELSQATDSL